MTTTTTSTTSTTSTGPSPRPTPWVLEVLDPEGRLCHRFPLPVGHHQLGSAPDATVCLAGPGVSRRHAEIEVRPDGCLELRDLGSKNGTAIEGQRIDRQVLRRPTEVGFAGVATRLRPDLGAVPHLLAGSTTPRRPAGLPPPPTQNTSLAARLLASLRGRLGGGGGAAAELAGLWLAELPLDSIEFRRRGYVVARAGRESTGAARGELTGPEGWSLVWTAAEARPPESLADGFALALELLAGGPRGATADHATPPGPRSPASAHPGLRRTYAEAARLARGTIPILLLGESGSGKEVLASFVHASSPRAGGPFLAINCAALPTELLEAELFGIEKGVATGVEARPGLLERAHGGTLFLDEIGDLPLPLQAKVLRVLEGAPYYRVGGRQAQRAEVRFLAATHVDLPGRIADQRFRGDLYYRLSAATLELPPLRERPQDVPLLATQFFAADLADRSVDSPGITERALAALQGHDWPGNVRELRHEIARAVLLLDPGEPLDLHHLRPRLQAAHGARPDLSLATATRQAERAAFFTALRLAEGDPVRARTLLDVSRTTYYRKLRELGLDATPKIGTEGGDACVANPEDGL